MKPILFYDDRSPPVRSCLMLIKILKLDIELKLINLFKGEHLSAEFISVNPAHTVPTLKDGNIILTDSHSILIYLCQKYAPDTDLYSRDETLQIKIINKLLFECSILFRRDSDMMSEIVRNQVQDVSKHQTKILEAYTILEKYLIENEYMACDHMTIADLSIVTTLSTVDMVFQVTADQWPRLYEWFMKMKCIPEYRSVNEIGLNGLKEAMTTFGKFQFPQHSA